MAAIIAGNPFLKEKMVDRSKLHVTFLQRAPSKTALPAFTSLKAGADRFACVGREIYLHCPGGYGKTRLSNSAIEKVLGVTATTRNWNTATKLFGLAAI